MVLIGFREQWEEPIQSGRKTRTTRKNARYYFKLAGYDEGEVDMIIYRAEEQGPQKRSSKNMGHLSFFIGHRGNWKRKLGDSIERYPIEAWKGEHFTDEMADEDGFGSVQEMHQWLAAAHDMTMAEVLEHVWVSFPIRIRRVPRLDQFESYPR